jgi:transposase-like protein
MTSLTSANLGRFVLQNKITPKEVTVGKSSTSSKAAVKVNPKQQQEISKIFGLDVQKIIAEGMESFIASGTKVLLESLMKAEVQDLCGDWHGRGESRDRVRWGFEQGTAKVGGGIITITRPRVRLLRGLGRPKKKNEVRLETYAAMNRDELLDGPLVVSIMSGVTARKYADIFSRGLELRGISKSSVSRKMIAATKPLIDGFRKREIGTIEPVVLLFDGIHVAKRQLIVCIGIDGHGRKHVLGLQTGATENEIVCRDLIRDLVDRGLKTTHKYLFVIDGSRALAAAIRRTFGQEAAIQRCQEHKIRDVQAYLPHKKRNEIREKMMAAYNQSTEKGAILRLSQIRTELANVSEAAVNSLTEGMLETLTVHRLRLKGMLRASLRTTNIIESAFSSVRRYMGRVTNFRSEEDRERWLIRSLVETEKHFRALAGYRQIAKLKQTLQTYDPRTPLG